MSTPTAQPIRELPWRDYQGGCSVNVDGYLAGVYLVSRGFTGGGTVEVWNWFVRRSGALGNPNLAAGECPTRVAGEAWVVQALGGLPRVMDVAEPE